MSFTIYQNNEKQIEIITRPKMGSSTLQHPGLIYSNDYGQDYPDAVPGLFKIKKDWSRYDGYASNPNNNIITEAGISSFVPSHLHNLNWIGHLKPDNTKYFLYRDPIKKYISGLTQLYFYGQEVNTNLIVPEGIDPTNFKMHTVSAYGISSLEVSKKLLHYYEDAPDSFFETYISTVEEINSNELGYSPDIAYLDSHIIRGLIHAVILKLLYPEKTQLVLLDNLDDVIRKHIISDDDFDVERINVTISDRFNIESLLTQDPNSDDLREINLNKIKKIMHNQFNKLVRKELACSDGPNNTKGFLDLEIKIWNELENNSEPLSILKMVVTELTSNVLPVIHKIYYEHIIRCFRNKYGII